ncbi:amidohydrolase family protein [Sutterella sp.]|uniref:amidohydrolase family protein n=1 Tax=Sutterella sp. TaxID=1981025 RepID=UPI0026DF106D|nr:amidohydrolase family protein [Sutterella sp.]MDO5532296.1 amidohydrolase family protein [Sutterella sp.]
MSANDLMQAFSISRRRLIQSAAAGAGLYAAHPMMRTASAAGASKNFPLIDAHLHYLDFMQETDGFDALIAEMDRLNVTHAVLFGMGMAKQWDEHAPKRPSYYLSNDSRCYYFSATDYRMMLDYMQLPPEKQARFFPFVCGINPNDRYAARHIEQVLDDFPGVFMGIGEVMSRHDDLTALTYGEPPAADHKAFLSVYDLAAERNLPVLIHHNVSSSYNAEPIYLEEMRNALKHNRKTNIIWAHVGISRRVEIPNLIEIADRMLEENPNLYFDISWVVYEEYIHLDARSLNDWARLFEKHPTRFLVGTDKVGHWKTYGPDVTKYYDFLAKLSDETRELVSRGNILRLIHQEKAA